jgi:hypothetical protein
MGRARGHIVLRAEEEAMHCGKIPELLVVNNQKEVYGQKCIFFLYGEKIIHSIWNAPCMSPHWWRHTA